MSLHQLFWATGTFLSLSLSVFWDCYKKNGGGEGKCVVSSACRLNLSGKGTCNCKLTQLIMKQTSKLSSVICKVRIRSQQTNSPLLSPDKRALAHTHTHTHTHTHWSVVFLSCPLVKKHADLSGSFLYSQSTMKDMYSKPTNRTELSIPMKTKSTA